MQEVKITIEKNIGTISTISDAAAHLKMSPETLKKKFRREEGVSLSEFIDQKKIEAMKKLLQEHNLSCCEICYAFGMREDSGARFFKRHTGITMKQYRIRNTLIAAKNICIIAKPLQQYEENDLAW